MDFEPTDAERAAEIFTSEETIHRHTADEMREWFSNAIESAGFPALLTDRDDLVRKLGELEAKYEELIYAVSIKHPQEDRHETALRYITQAETNCGQGGAALKVLDG